VEIWGTQPLSVVEHFRHWALSERVRFLLLTLPSQSIAEIERALQLVGAAALVKQPDLPTEINWPGGAKVVGLLSSSRLRLAGRSQSSSGLWLGIREFVRLAGFTIPAPAGLLRDAAAAWKECVAPTDKFHALNQWMAAWLDACAAEGVLLPFDDVPLVVPSVPTWLQAAKPTALEMFDSGIA